LPVNGFGKPSLFENFENGLREIEDTYRRKGFLRSLAMASALRNTSTKAQKQR